MGQSAVAVQASGGRVACARGCLDPARCIPTARYPDAKDALSNSNCGHAAAVSQLEKRDTFRRHRSPTRSPRSRCLISRLAPRVSSRFYASSATMTSRSTSAPAGPTRTTRLCPASLHHAVKSLTQSLTPDGLWVSETTAKWPESASAANHILIFVADSPRIRHYCEKSAI
jgi:hypothetical protein